MTARPTTKADLGRNTGELVTEHRRIAASRSRTPGEVGDFVATQHGDIRIRMVVGRLRTERLDSDDVWREHPQHHAEYTARSVPEAQSKAEDVRRFRRMVFYCARAGIACVTAVVLWVPFR